MKTEKTEKKVKKTTERVEVSLDSVKIGDTVFLDAEDTVSYLVLDIGSPFVLILNNETNFANMYKCDKKLYKTK